MTLVTASIEIDAPRERVYDFMLDPANKIGYVRITQFTDRTIGELRIELSSQAPVI